jgi:transcriptional regulator with GAF, ATPase, and Fis domain
VTLPQASPADASALVVAPGFRPEVPAAGDRYTVSSSSNKWGGGAPTSTTRGAFMDGRATALSALARFQVTDMTVGEALHRIAEIMRDAVPAADFVGLTMLGEDGRPTTGVYTDKDLPTLDEAQYQENKGPCLDAWRHNTVRRLKRVGDHAKEYPGFVAACFAHGVQATLSMPLVAGDVALGALNLYSRVAEGFGEDDELVAGDLAAAAAAVMGNISAYWMAVDLSQNLREAMKSRAVIEQAKGVLIASTPGLTADGAFDMLRRASQRENAKLRDIAARIVEGTLTRRDKESEVE